MLNSSSAHCAGPQPALPVPCGRKALDLHRPADDPWHEDELAMDARISSLDYGWSPVSFGFEALALFGMLALPFLLLKDLESYNGLLGCGAIALMYLVATYIAAARQADAPSAVRVAGFAILQSVGGMMAAVALLVLTLITFLLMGNWADSSVTVILEMESQDMGGGDVEEPDGRGILTIGLMYIGPFVLMMLAGLVTLSSLLPLRPDGERVFAYGLRIAAKEPAGALLTMSAGFTVGLTAFGVVVTLSAVNGLNIALETSTPIIADPLVIGLALRFPIVPVGLIALAAIMVAHRRILPFVLTRFRIVGPESRRTRRKIASLAKANFAGAVLFMGESFYALHIRMTEAYGDRYCMLC